MHAVDAAAPEPVEVLIERAGHAVARAAASMLGGTYGRHVIVLAGRGNNGADGRISARVLAAAGARVDVIEVSRVRPCPSTLAPCDLVIDAVLGTGATGDFVGPDQPAAPVLAVDLPSGVDADTGAITAASRVLRATRTVTFAAWKPGLLLGAGAELAGRVDVVDIGLALPGSLAEEPGVHVANGANVIDRLPQRRRAAHKWSAAVGVIAGSPGMAGAASLVALGALRSGAGMVRVGSPGGVADGQPIEAVYAALPQNHWVSAAVDTTSRCHAVVVGPGLGRARATLASARAFILRASQPVVIDADAFAALGDDVDDERGGTSSAAEARRGTLTSAPPAPLNAGLRAVQQASARRQGLPLSSVVSISRTTAEIPAGVLSMRRAGSTVLTPHDGEFEVLTGRRVGPDRLAAARDLAAKTSSVVLLKGPTTVIADPGGRVELVRVGDDRLATAGTGDVLSGVIGAFLAQGLSTFDAAVCGAYVHGAAALRGRRVGLVASDLPSLIADLLTEWAPSETL